MTKRKTLPMLLSAADRRFLESVVVPLERIVVSLRRAKNFAAAGEKFVTTATRAQPKASAGVVAPRPRQARR